VLALDPSGAPQWAKRFGDAADQSGPGHIGVDSTGNIVLAGNFKGSLDFGVGALSASIFSSLYVAKLNASGDPLWSKSMAAGATQAGPFPDIFATVDGADNVILTGAFPGTADFGGGPLTSAGDLDAFVVKLDADGHEISARLFGDSQRQTMGIALASGMDMLYVPGTFAGTIDLGGGLLASKGDSDAFLAKFLLP